MTAPKSSSASFGDSFEAAEKTVRFLAIDAVEKAKSGHPGAPMGQATIAVELFANHLVYNPADPAWPNRDRFVLSCGHASMLIYSILHLTGYDVSLDDLKSFRQWDSKTPGHPEARHTPGVETTTGPLGQGIGNAVGMALAGKLTAARMGSASELMNYKVYALCSDGDLMEGVAYEAASLAGHLGLDNLIVVYDDNRITIDGTTELSFTEDVGARFVAMGWNVARVDGHDRAAVGRALDEGKRSSKPFLIVARTHIGFGSPKKQDTSDSHGAPLGADEARATKAQAGWPLEPTFYVPDEAYQAFDGARERNSAAYDAWTDAIVKAKQSGAANLDAFVAVPPADLFEQLVAVAGSAADATRNHGGRIQQKVAELCPYLVGGSADLAGSVKTRIKGSGDIQPGKFDGRNMNFGVREHAMGSVMNGMALSSTAVPFGSTFLIFGDYMRPAMRLAGLMKLQVVYVFSHDSIFLGEDGPTHQPVEQLWTMRMVPNLDVFRPADALECAAAWAYAMQRADGPTVLSLTRHTVPALERPLGFTPRDILKGAYAVTTPKDPKLTLIATGSEVCVALEAAALLDKDGIAVRVVSMPCVDAFLRLSRAEQDQILPPGVRRASLELGVSLPWKAITGLDGINIGIDTFGASAPFEVLQEKFGVTAPAVARTLRAALAA